MAPNIAELILAVSFTLRGADASIYAYRPRAVKQDREIKSYKNDFLNRQLIWCCYGVINYERTSSLCHPFEITIFHR